MAKVQTRRSISMRQEPHAQLKAHAEEAGTSMSKIVTAWVEAACSMTAHELVHLRNAADAHLRDGKECMELSPTTVKRLVDSVVGR